MTAPQDTTTQEQAFTRDGEPLTEIQTVLYARFGVVVEPLPPSPRQHTDAERRALDWQAHKYVHGEFRQSVRAFRVWLESQQLNSDGENE